MSYIHQIFNFDSPTCLYCKSSCKINSWGANDEAAETYSCISCNEKFEFIYLNDQLISTVFTCSNIEIVHQLEFDSFGVQFTDIQSGPFNRIWIPSFFIDFTSKDALIAKINNCLLFS